MFDAHQDFGPGLRPWARPLSSSLIHTQTHIPVSVYSWWCTHKPTRWKWSIHENEWGSDASERATGSRCSDTARGVADGVLPARVYACVSG